MTTQQYNFCLDFIKGIACIFVVFMHCEFPGLMGTAVQAISRFCVPFFFMVSGYFCFHPLTQKFNSAPEYAELGSKWQIVRKKVIHIAKITFYASLFYLTFVLLQQLFLHNQNFTITLRQIFSNR